MRPFLFYPSIKRNSMTEHIWNKFRAELLGFIKSRIRNKDVAEDLLQEVFIKIHSKANSLTKEDKLTAWVYQITRNTIIDYYRKAEPHIFQEDVKPGLIDDPKNLNKDLLVCLKPFIEELPEKYCEALLQTSFENKSQKEYAEQNGLTYSAAKSRIQRARIQLKDLFMDCCQISSDKYGNIIDIDKSNCACD